MDVNVNQVRDKLIKNIKYIIEKTDKTQKEIEIELELGTGYLSKIFNETNTQIPNYVTIYKIANMANISIDRLSNADLEQLEQNDTKINLERQNSKERLFLEKIIKQTEEGCLDWNKVSLPSGSRCLGGLFDPTFDQGEMNLFSSQLGRSTDYKSSAFNCYLKSDFYLMLVNLPCGRSDEMGYEAYVVEKNRKSYLCSTSHLGEERDAKKYKMLDDLWKKVNDYMILGKRKIELDKIYDILLSDEEDEGILPYPDIDTEIERS